MPSARNATAFIITGSTDAPSDAIASKIGMVAVKEADAAAEQSARQRMTALVKPGSLIGHWVTADQGIAACCGPVLI